MIFPCIYYQPCRYSFLKICANGYDRDVFHPFLVYILIGGIKIRLKISIFYGEKVVHLADF